MGQVWIHPLRFFGGKGGWCVWCVWMHSGHNFRHAAVPARSAASTPFCAYSTVCMSACGVHVLCAVYRHACVVWRVWMHSGHNFRHAAVSARSAAPTPFRVCGTVCMSACGARVLRAVHMYACGAV